MADDDPQQRITFLLQEIDANICAAHRSATQICSTVRRHHQILRQIHEASEVWRPLFESFTIQQPISTRGVPATPTADVARNTSSPSFSAASKRSDQVPDTTTRNLSFSDDELEPPSLTEEEQTFKTTTLRRLGESSAEVSLNMSINTDRLPRMSRTPYIEAARGHHRQASDPADGHVSIVSTNTTNWTPAMSSPPRTDILTVQEQNRLRPPTPPSTISSIAPSSPVVSKNLMQIGAFEYTPPHHGRSLGAAVGQCTSPVAPSSVSDPKSPPMPNFATVDVHESVDNTISDIDPGTAQSDNVAMSGQRKRRRPGISSPRAKTPSRHPSPSHSLSIPGSYTSLRRKYSTAEYTTPTRTRIPETNPKTIESIKKASQELLKNESPMTPSFELPSPLLRTQLKAMTPHTPLSNRLVGANLDIGSTSQESKLQDYDESFNAGEPAPEFQLSLFPSAFQRGIGAVQISTLYSKFQGSIDSEKPALNVDQLVDALPDYGRERIEILLDTLVSRRLLRPFVVEGIMFWQIPL